MDEKTVESQRFLSESEQGDIGAPISKRRRTSYGKLGTVLIVSFLLNVTLAWLYLAKHHESLSEYASLTWTETSTWSDKSPFYNRHRKTQSDQAWEKLDFSLGMIAIDDQEAAELNLPRSQRFPWDQSKGIYLLNSYHNLHCLKWLWKSLAKFRDGGKFDRIDWHGFHCLESLRQDTICYADDTPRYTGEGQDNTTSGFHQNRKCRDWGKLEQWAKERSSCYRFLQNHVESTLDRHMFCPPDSPYASKIEAIYGPGERQRLIDLYGSAAA